MVLLFIGTVIFNNFQADVVGGNTQNVAVVHGVAGDWFSTTDGGKLTVTINGDTINFSTHLTMGDGFGFLGFVRAGKVGITSLVFSTEEAGEELFLLNYFQIAGCPAKTNK
jgi:hypothetical protein